MSTIIVTVKNITPVRHQLLNTTRSMIGVGETKEIEVSSDDLAKVTNNILSRGLKTDPD